MDYDLIRKTAGRAVNECFDRKNHPGKALSLPGFWNSKRLGEVKEESFQVAAEAVAGDISSTTKRGRRPHGTHLVHRARRAICRFVDSEIKQGATGDRPSFEDRKRAVDQWAIDRREGFDARAEATRSVMAQRRDDRPDAHRHSWRRLGSGSGSDTIPKWHQQDALLDTNPRPRDAKEPDRTLSRSRRRIMEDREFWHKRKQYLSGLQRKALVANLGLDGQEPLGYSRVGPLIGVGEKAAKKIVLDAIDSLATDPLSGDVMRKEDVLDTLRTVAWHTARIVGHRQQVDRAPNASHGKRGRRRKRNRKRSNSPRRR